MNHDGPSDIDHERTESVCQWKKCPECDGNVSSLAETCPHCGYPLKNKEPATEYVLSKGHTAGSGFASFLQVLAWLVWIGGLIISIAGAQVTEVGRYSSSTHFSFSAFITLFLAYLIYGILLMGMASIVETIANTYSIVSGLELDKQKPGFSGNTGKNISQKPSGNTEENSSIKLSVPRASEWKCSACGHINEFWRTSCINCREPKVLFRRKQ